MPRVVRLDTLQQFAAINVLSDPGYIAGPKIIPGAAMVRLNWQLNNGRTAHNIMYASWNGTPALSATSAQAIFGAISSGATWTALAGFLIPQTTLTGVTLLDMRSTTATYFNSTGAAVPGVSAGTALPDESAVAVTLFTANRGPSGRGRIYLPGWASTAMAAGGVVAAAAITALNNWMSGSVGPAVSSNVGPLVLGLPARAAYTSPITGRQFPARNATTVPITGIATRDNHWDSQRRRGLK